MADKKVWEQLHTELAEKGITLVAVSKKKPVADIKELYDMGQRDFGENYVQELLEKQAELPADIRWHFIGHLQSNKVKEIAPFVHLIHAVDSFKLLAEIGKQGARCGRVIDVLLQLHIAEEETKFGMDEQELMDLIRQYETAKNDLAHVRICGLMGMATNTDNGQQVSKEFSRLHNFLIQLSKTEFADKPCFSICSMGMSADYTTAIATGSNMVRIGSMLFGKRQYGG